MQMTKDLNEVFTTLIPSRKATAKTTQEPIQEAKSIDETAQFIEELKQTIKLHENRLEELKKLITEYDSRLDAKIEELVDLMIKRLK